LLLECAVRLSIFAIFLLLAIPAFAVALFRCRGAARDEGTLEYVFEADEQSGANAATKEKVAEIAAVVVTTFLETQKLRTTPLPSGFAFSDTIKGPLRQLFFVVLLPDGTVVEPRVEKRL
jgi:hypothetical protein